MCNSWLLLPVNNGNAGDEVGEKNVIMQQNVLQDVLGVEIR
jgi:hypothetical protein